MRLTIYGSGDAFGSGGRFNTCLALEGRGETMLVDCGASAPTAWNLFGLDRNAVSAILLTHFHGDHVGGLPAFLLDARFISRRRTPLVIAGPRGVHARVRAVTEALFPGYWDAPQSFPLEFIEVSPNAPVDLAGFLIETFPMVHDDRAGPCQGYRFANDGKVFAFSGDTTWTDALVPLGRAADLFLCECYTATTAIPNHLNWRDLEARLPQIAPRRTLLTHMGPEMLAFDGRLPVERAEDGQKLAV